MPSASAGSHDIAAALARLPIFSQLAPAVIEQLRDDSRELLLAAGDTLFRQGDPVNGIYLVMRGTLHVIVDAGDRPRIVDTLKAGAVLGEMGVLLGEPRSASVVARRDARLLHIPLASVEKLLAEQASVSRHLATLLSSRLKQTTRQIQPHTTGRLIAVIHDHPDAAEFLRILVASLNQQGTPAAVVTRDSGADADWEERFHTLFAMTDDSPEWSAALNRQADGFLVVSDVRHGIRHDALARLAGPRPIDLVLWHEGEPPPQQTRRHLEMAPYARHFHVRRSRPDDYARVARHFSARAVGLVLSGGGARGFAHIGVLDALRRRNIPVDAIGGASMGAIIAAQYAVGCDVDQIVRNVRAAFVDRQPSDMTLPMVALSSARASVHKMRRLFGEAQIEDAPCPFFCVSTDLTAAASKVHDSGPLWLWTRASSAIPGLAPPVVRGGHLLADGGLLNNLPADVMRERCAYVIGVDVTPDVDLLAADRDWPPHASGWDHLWRRMRGRGADHPGIVEILTRAALVGSKRDADRTAAHCDLLIRPDLASFGMSDFHAVDALVAAGRAAADAALANWKHDALAVSPS